MREIDVQLRHVTGNPQPAAAVLLPGTDAAVWLKGLGGDGADLTTLHLLPLMGPAGESDECGVLIPLPEGVIHRIDRRYPRYTCLSQRLFIPVEAEIVPPIADIEWKEMLPADDSDFVWHPRIGLVRIESNQRLRLTDLCVPPERVEADWGLAQPGNALNRRLLSLQAESLPQKVDQLMRQGNEEIGSQSDRLGTLPRSPREPSRFNWTMVAAAPLLPFALLAGWVSGLIPRSPNGSEFMTRVVSWLDRVASKLPHLMQEREREIQRLLDKLKNDPDEGLKYALPLSDVAGRGQADPGYRLTQRSVDFNLGTSGGGPVDTWQIGASLQFQLRESYRETAQRETRLGRYRRAAYIYASLLGDHQAAAAALEQGHFYHEAAAVYREKLKRPSDAARCLERGGLLSDAIEIYQELKQHIKVGELYERLQCAEEARAAFLLAVDERMLANDRLGAASLLEQRLHDSESALGVLEMGWPESLQGQQCLERFFAMTGTLGLHDRALQKIQLLKEQSLSLPRRSVLVETLSRVATSHTDQAVKARAADLTRILAAQVLTQVPESPGVLKAISSLAQEDMLLRRDCIRFGRSSPPAKAPVPSRVHAAKSPRGQFDNSIPLPDGYTWLSAESVGSHFYLVGHDSHQTLLLVRGAWNNLARISAAQGAAWTGRGVGYVQLPVMLACDVHDELSLRIAQYGCPPLPPRLMAATDDFPRSLSAESPPWTSKQTVAMGCNSVYSYTCDMDGQVNQYHRPGLLASTFQLEEFSSQPPDLLCPPTIHVRPREVYIGFGSTLHRISENGQRQFIQLPSRITGISGSRPHTRERLLVTHETGACFLTPTIKQFGMTTLEEDEENISGCILNDGRAILYRPEAGVGGNLVVYSGAETNVVIQQGTTPRHIDSSALRGEIRLVLPTSKPNQVALIPHGPGGSIELWSFP